MAINRNEIHLSRQLKVEKKILNSVNKKKEI